MAHRTLTVAAAVAALLAGCGTNTATKATETVTAAPKATETVTVTAATPPPPSTAAPAADGVRSELLPITLPAGTKAACCGKHEGLEVWNAPTAYSYNVQMLREQLPIKQTFEGLPWCSQTINGKLGLTQWDWASKTESIVVGVDSDGMISLSRGPDEEGRDGCDAP